MRTWPGILGPYGFFSSGSFLESTIWALGCMTTTIDFPGSSARASVKLLHAAILGVGLFQITYLLACFSILASTEAARTSSVADSLVSELEQTLAVAEELSKKDAPKTSG